MKRLSLLVLLAFASGCGSNASAVVGETRQFSSPSTVTESCVILTHIPGGDYSAGDVKNENEFCALDVYAPTVAMCPKTWSTSPGTMIYGTEGRSQADYEANRCTGKNGHDKLAKFKNTMNGSSTSSTFSTSALLYYHFSRYFNTSIDVPVSVYRSLDKDQHYARVTSRAQAAGKMGAAAWAILRAAEINPSSYSPTDELFTPDRKQIYGVLMKDKGVGYGPEIDGTEASGWGEGSNNDFQETPAFLAVRSEKELIPAIREGVTIGTQDPTLKKAIGAGVSDQQMVYWMKDLTEITLLDYIFSQQDRIENIDYVWEWTYVDAGGVKSRKVTDDRFEKLSRASMARIPMPTEIVAYKPVLLQRTVLGDNDAGGRVQYTNFTKRTKMLEKIRHYNGDTYRKLIALNKDFAAKGALYRYAAETFSLTDKQLAQLVNNTALATAIIQGTCRAGQLRFDLKPKAFMMGQSTVESVDCENP